MISAILFISFFIFLILGVPIGICLGPFLRMRNSLLRYIPDDRSNQHVLRDQQIPAPGDPILRTVRKHHGKSRYLQTTDQIR